MSQRQTNQRPLGRKTRQMTNIILEIEQRNDDNNAYLKDNAQAVLKMANKLFAPKMGDDALGNDDYREWLFKEDKAFAEYMYDEMGKPNKKGISKPIMGQHKKNIFGGIKTVATDNEGFLEWANQSDIGNEVSSLAKVTASINKYAKSLEPKTETGASDETGESETGESETIAKPSLEQVAQELLKRFTADECVKLSEMLYDMACENASDEAIEKVA